MGAQMKTMLGLAMAGAITFNVAACSSSPGERALGGAVIGGATGALIGGMISRNSGTGALVGGALGAATGAIIGAATTPQAPAARQCSHWGMDLYGREFCAGY
jgi:hypothetical protein